jgi:hypothetical protein
VKQQRTHGEPSGLRQALAALRGLSDRYKNYQSGPITGDSFDILFQEVQRIDSQFPQVLTSLNPEEMKGKWAGGRVRRYDLVRIQTWLALAIARLQSAVESEDVSTAAVTETDFSFIADSILRQIVERDYAEIGRAMSAGCWKSTLVLSGAIIEAILVDRLLRSPMAHTVLSAPKEQNPRKWRFVDLINVASELGLVSVALEKFSHSVRHYRNLVHLQKQAAEGLDFDAEEGRIAFEILGILCRELSRGNRGSKVN